MRRVVERVVVAHVAAYPIAFLTAIAAMPLTMYLHLSAMAKLEDNPDVIGMYVVRLVAWPAGGVFLLAHLLVAPWVIDRDEVRGRRWFLRAAGALAGVVVLFGAASWLWLYLR